MTKIAWILLLSLLSGCIGESDCTDCPSPDMANSVPAQPEAEGPPDPTPPGEQDEGNVTLNQTLVDAPQPPGNPFDLQATDCDELLALVPIDATVARTHVPGAYALLLDQAGQATALVNIKDCATMSIDGVEQGRGTGADVGVLIDQGEPGVFHYYQVHWMASSNELTKRLVGMGWQVTLSTDHLAASAPGITAATAGLFGTLNLDGVAIVDGPGNTNAAVGYYDGLHGTITVTKDVDGTAGAFGTGPVVFEATNDIAALLGEAGNGLGIHLRYDLNARIDYLA